MGDPNTSNQFLPAICASPALTGPEGGTEPVPPAGLAFANNAAIPTVPAGGADLQLLAAIATVKGSGRFEVSGSVAYTSALVNVPAWKFNTQFSASPVTPTHATPVGLGSFVWDGTNALAFGMLFPGAGGAQTQEALHLNQAGAASPNGYVTWSGVVDNAGAPFAPGSTVVFYIETAESTNALTFLTGSIALREIP
jgi:hypothetical protein